MPPPRPSKPASTRVAAAKPAAAPAKPASARVPAAPPAGSKTTVRQPPRPGSAGRRANETVHTERVRVDPKRRQMKVMALLGLGAVVIIVGIASLNPWLRSRQLAAIDAASGDAARQLAAAFAAEWGARSTYVLRAVGERRGPLEARIEWCVQGRLVTELADLLRDVSLTPAQRGMACEALVTIWPDERQPRLPDQLPAWATGADSPPEQHGPALRLLIAAAPSGADSELVKGATDAALSSERAIAAAMGLIALSERKNAGVSGILVALEGPHRASLLAHPALVQALPDLAVLSDGNRMLALLDKPDSSPLGLMCFAGKRFQLPPPSDAKLRATVAERLARFLAPESDDAVLKPALAVVRRQQLVEAKPQLLALLPRLSSRPPEGVTAKDAAEIIGRAIVNTKTPAGLAAAEDLVASLAKALDGADTRDLAAASLGRFPDAGVKALRKALDALAVHADASKPCAEALEALLEGPYGRADIASAGQRRGWKKTLDDDNAKRASLDAIEQWLEEHKDETTVRTDQKIIAANKKKLGEMRDELRGWMESKDPLPLGLTKAQLDELSNRVNLVLQMTLKATTG